MAQVGITAVRQGEINIVQSSMVGSILSGNLLVSVGLRNYFVWLTLHVDPRRIRILRWLCERCRQIQRRRQWYPVILDGGILCNTDHPLCALFNHIIQIARCGS